MTNKAQKLDQFKRKISSDLLESTGILVEFLTGVGLVAADAELILAVFSLIVAESTVFCRLKFDVVELWLWFEEFGVPAGTPATQDLSKYVNSKNSVR